METDGPLEKYYRSTIFSFFRYGIGIYPVESHTLVLFFSGTDVTSGCVPVGTFCRLTPQEDHPYPTRSTWIGR